MELTLAITNYNRHEMLLESYKRVIDDPRIAEVVIMDDCSNLSIYNAIQQQSHRKLKITRQAQNRGMGRNKSDAIAFSQNEWVIIFDSDNVIDTDYLDAIPLDLFPDTIFMPTFAKPQFDYSRYAGLQVDRKNVGQYIDDPMFNCAMNTCNFLVHRDTYLSVYQENKEHKASDTIWMNYLWLASGRKFYFMPDCEYEHRVHAGSGFMQDAAYNMAQGEKVRKLIKHL